MNINPSKNHNIQLLPYQIDVISKILQNKTVMVDADTGAGKTVIGLTTISALGAQKLIKKVLITGPLNASSAWEKVELKDPITDTRYTFQPFKKLKELYDIDVEFIGLQSVYRGKLNASDYKIVKEEGEEKKVSSNKIVGTYNDYDVLIIDESHNVKNWRAQQTQFLLELSKSIPYKILFSATPQEKSKADLWAQYMILNSNIFPVISAYNNKYCRMDERFKPFKDIDNLELHKEFAAIIADYLYYVPRDITDKFKPKEKADIIHSIDKTKEMRVEEKDVKLKLKELYSGKGMNIMHEAAILFNLYIGSYDKITYLPSDTIPGLVDEIRTPQVIPSHKFTVLDNLVNTLNKPLILVASYNAEISRLEEYCKLKNLAYRVIKGGVAAKKRTIIKNEFNTHEIEILIMNISAGNASLDLYGGNHVVFMSINPAYIKNYQVKGRICRTGSKYEEVHYHYIVTKKSLEEKFYTLIQNKETNINVLKKVLRQYVNN